MCETLPACLPGKYRQTLSAPDWNDRARDVSLYALGVRDRSRRTAPGIYKITDDRTLRVKRERIHYQLEMELGLDRDRFFLDIESIDPGEIFADKIGKVLRKTKVFIAVIGPTWLSAADSSHKRRLDQPDDFVRTEIELALNDSEIHVIPLLVRGAAIPESRGLTRPDPIAVPT